MTGAATRPSAAQRLAAFATSLRHAAIPPDVAEAATLALLDTLGCGLAAHGVGVAGAGRAAMLELGGAAQATAIGLPGRLPAPGAALANGMVCHGLDFDSTHPEAVCHVSAVVGPTVLAAAEAHRAPGAECVAALVAGSEVVARLGMAASGVFHARGFHPTAVCGIFGAAAAAARLRGLDAARAASALGIAGSMASGLLAYLGDGTPTKPIHPGWAAHGGILAAALAAHGAEGPGAVLDGRFGLFHAFVGLETVDLGPELADLGTRWETRRMAYKRYPACHLMHGVLAAAAEATGGRRLAAEEIVDVLVTVPEAAVPIVLEPAAAKVAPRTEYEGKFSLQFSTAAMLVHGAIGVATYTEPAMQDAQVLAASRRVRYATRAYPTAGGTFPGGVRIELRDGATLAAEFPRGSDASESAVSAEEVRTKFRDNAALALDAAAAMRLEEAVLGLGGVADVGAAVAPLAEARVQRGLLPTRSVVS